MKPKYLTIKQVADQTIDMFIDGEITAYAYDEGETSAAGFRDALKEAGPAKTINLHINSPGGSVFEGIAICNMLKQNSAKVNVYVDGLAASIASVIAMCGDTIFMPQNAMMMIHNPLMMVGGNAAELRKASDDLDQITKSSVVTYLAKAGDKLDEPTLKQLMDDETWLTAQEAVDYGLADVVLEANQMVASLSPKLMGNYHNVPKQFTDEKLVDTSFRRNLIDRVSASNQKVNQTLGGF